MDVAINADKSRAVLDDFAIVAELPAIARLTQDGRDAETARYSFELADGRVVRIGTIKTLWSYTECSKVLAVTLGKPLPPMKPATWCRARDRLIEHAVEVQEREGETFADTVRDWLGDHCERAESDRDGAMAARRPFIADGDIHVHAVSLARDIRRQYSASVKERELISALGDLGFERRTMNYTRGNRRTTASYYVAPIDVLDPGDNV